MDQHPPENAIVAERGALISDHPHPRPFVRQITAGLAAVGLGGAVFGVIGLIVVGIGLGLPLLLLMAVFLTALIVPLLQLTVLHPRVTVYEGGLWIKPLVWRGRWIRWEAVSRVEAHTLIRRGKTKDREREHFGQLIVVDEGLPRLFEIVGVVAGLGRVRAFGISTHSHVDYKPLLNAIQRYKRRS